MRFLANENFPLTSAKKLRTAGLDVTSVMQIMAGANDEQILSIEAEETLPTYSKNQLIQSID